MTVMDTETRRLTGAQILVEHLVNEGVTLAAGIPGHGCWAITDALLDRRDAIRTVQVMHEQSAVHLADGWYRATGRPMLAFTSIGPGAMNTVIGMGTAYVDSTAVALVTGSPHTYMRGHGLFQELERRHHADNPRVFEPVVKEWWQPSRVDELPFVLHRAWNPMTRAARDRCCSTCRWTSRPRRPTSGCRTPPCAGPRPGPAGGRRRRAGRGAPARRRSGR